MLKHTFERINPHSLTSLHTTRHELTYILTMIPTRTICSLDFRFIVAIHISTLQHFEKFFEKLEVKLKRNLEKNTVYEKKNLLACKILP